MMVIDIRVSLELKSLVHDRLDKGIAVENKSLSKSIYHSIEMFQYMIL